MQTTEKMLLLAAGAVLVAGLHAATPKYVFMFIGDGMGMPQRMVAEDFSRRTGRGPLAMNALPYQGLTRTASANQLITDSAAAATARIAKALAKTCDSVDYAEAVDADTLEPVKKLGPNTLLAVAAYVGKTRLIDNHLL